MNDFFSQAYVLKSSILDTPRCIVWLKYYRNGLKHEVLNKSMILIYNGIANTFFIESIYSFLSTVKA